MAEFINTIDVIGDDALTRSIVNGSIIEFRDNIATSVGAYGLYRRLALTTVSFPAVTSIGSNAFEDCSALATADFPAVTSIGSYAFRNCSALATAYFPVVTSIDGMAFQYCSTLATISFPAATTIQSSVFSYCSSLTTADFQAVTGFLSSTFQSCSALTALILRKTAGISDLRSSNVFNGTPIASGTGYIYVPSALVDKYKAATNWSTYAAQFRALEDYTVDGTTTGELDPNKI